MSSPKTIQTQKYLLHTAIDFANKVVYKYDGNSLQAMAV